MKHFLQSDRFLYLLFGLSIFSIVLNAFPGLLWSIVTWENGRIFELLFLFATALGVFLAFYQFRITNERQKKIDYSSVSVNIKSGTEGEVGIFTITNYGDIEHMIRVEKAILNDGTQTPTDSEIDTPSFEKVFFGLIKPKQNIDLHLFNLSIEEIFVYRGLVRLTIDNKVITETKVKFSGKHAETIKDKCQYLHPFYKWIIYSQK